MQRKVGVPFSSFAIAVDMQTCAESLSKTTQRYYAKTGAITVAVAKAVENVSTPLEKAIANGYTTATSVFDRSHLRTPYLKPRKSTSSFECFTATVFSAIQKMHLTTTSRLGHADAVDNNSYFPPHNGKFSQPLTGDCKTGLDNDRTGSHCGSYIESFRQLTNECNTGKAAQELCVPVCAAGKHRRGFRTGYRSEQTSKSPTQAIKASVPSTVILAQILAPAQKRWIH